MDRQKVAERYIDNGWSIIPLREDKLPLVDWGKYSVMQMKKEDLIIYSSPACKGIALVTGYNHLTCVDVDLKYDVTGDLYKRLTEALGESILSKVAIHKTINSGYHLLFTSPKCEGSQKLAARPATRDEKMFTLYENIAQKKDVDDCLRTALNDKSRTLIETRGVGGYCVIPPTDGYTHIQGKISHITAEEYDFVIDTCRSFNSYIKPVANFVSRGSLVSGQENIFFEINKNYDVLSLLKENGWEPVGNASGGLIKIKRPGKSTNPHSAYFDPEKNIFWCFSTSSGFEMNKTYSAVDLLLYFRYDDNKERLFELRKDFLNVN